MGQGGGRYLGLLLDEWDRGGGRYLGLLLDEWGGVGVDTFYWLNRTGVVVDT